MELNDVGNACCGDCRHWMPVNNPEVGQNVIDRSGFCYYPVQIPRKAPKWMRFTPAKMHPNNSDECLAFEVFYE